MTAGERAVMQQVFQGARGGAGGEGRLGGPTSERAAAGPGATVAADYLVFVLHEGAPTIRRIKTGLTDLDYSEVLEGLTATDSVLLLPNISQPAP